MKAVTALLCAWLLAGCDGRQEDDLRRWMEEVRARRSSPPAVAVPRVDAEVFRYAAGTQGDPFDVARLSPSEEPAKPAGIEPDLRRTREPLEAFALDSLRLVGSLRRGTESVALVQAEQLIHPVRVGSHLGQDFGRVVGVGESSVEIEELVRDGEGGWTRRRTQLRLQEKR